MTQDPGYPWARPTTYSRHSLRRNRKAAAWAWQSVSRSSNRKADGSGQTATAGVARRSTSPCQRLPRKQTPRRCRVIWRSAEWVRGSSRRHLMHNRLLTYRQMISRQVAESSAARPFGFGGTDRTLFDEKPVFRPHGLFQRSVSCYNYARG